jgi:chromosome segregation ATPase
MTRRTVAVVDLPTLFKSLFDKRIEPVRREAEGLCRKVQDGLDLIKDTGTKLLKENIAEDLKEASKSSISSSDKFGRKIIDLVEGVKPPTEMTYDDLIDYTNALRNFQSQIVNAASIWVPKLPLQLKGTIRELEAKMKLLGYSVNSLENHVGGKHRQVDKLEKILEDSRLLVSLYQDVKDLDAAIRTHEENAEKLEAERQNIDRLIKELDLHDISKRMIEQEKQLESLRNQISEVFHPLEKPMEKLLKTVDSKNGLLTSDAQDTLQHYLNDPVEAVENEQSNFSRLRSALEALRNVLKRGSIELKESRVRNALKTISEIGSSNNLEILSQSYRQLQLEHHTTSSSREAIEIAHKRRELESQKQHITNERSRLDSDLQTLQSRRNELSLRFSRIRTDLEKRSKSIAGEDVEILQDSKNDA